MVAYLQFILLQTIQHQKGLLQFIWRWRIVQNKTNFSLITPQWTQNICITFMQCWANVEDVEPTLYKCYANVLCLLGLSIIKRNLWNTHHWNFANYQCYFKARNERLQNFMEIYLELLTE